MAVNDLEGAEGVEDAFSSPSQFAALWNKMSDEHRRGWLVRIAAMMDMGHECFMHGHKAKIWERDQRIAAAIKDLGGMQWKP